MTSNIQDIAERVASSIGTVNWVLHGEPKRISLRGEELTIRSAFRAKPLAARENMVNGFDNESLTASFLPPSTTNRQPLEEMAIEAQLAAVQQIDAGVQSPGEDVLP